MRSRTRFSWAIFLSEKREWAFVAGLVERLSNMHEALGSASDTNPGMVGCSDSVRLRPA